MIVVVTMGRRYTRAQLVKQGVDGLADYFGVVATSAQVRALLDADPAEFANLVTYGVDTVGRDRLIDAIAASIGAGPWPRYGTARPAANEYFVQFAEKARAAGWGLKPNFLDAKGSA